MEIADGTAIKRIAAYPPRIEEAIKRIKRIAARRHQDYRHISDMAGVQLRKWMDKAFCKERHIVERMLPV